MPKVALEVVLELFVSRYTSEHKFNSFQSQPNVLEI